MRIDSGRGWFSRVMTGGAVVVAVVGLVAMADPGQDEGPARPKGGKATAKDSDPPEAKGDETPANEGLKGPEGRVERTDEEWRRRLTPLQYYVTRQKGTERAWSGRYARGRYKGTFKCVGCGAALFSSNHKFESGTGWPSFWQPVREDALATAFDYSDGTERVEVNCSRCDAHLGHVFDDGPRPTGLRFCINSAALKLEPFAATGKSKTKATGKARAKADADTSKAKGVAKDATGDERPAGGPGDEPPPKTTQAEVEKGR